MTAEKTKEEIMTASVHYTKGKLFDMVSELKQQNAALIEINKSQYELLESMGETNKQLAKRLGAIQHEVDLDCKPLLKVLSIMAILKPAPLTDGL